MPKFKAVAFGISMTPKTSFRCWCKSEGTCYYMGKDGLQDKWLFICKNGHSRKERLSRGCCPYCGKEKKSHRRKKSSSQNENFLFAPLIDRTLSNQ